MNLENLLNNIGIIINRKNTINQLFGNPVHKSSKEGASRLYTFGEGIYKSRNEKGNLNVPTPLEFLGVTQVSCGDDHTAVIANGVLYTFGKNAYGQLGQGNRDYLFRPTLVPNIENGFQNRNVTQVSCGYDYTAVIADSVLYTFGKNWYGQLGQGNTDFFHVPTQVPNLKNVTHVSCGMSHTAVIANKKLYTFGSDSNGQLGQGDIKNKKTTPNDTSYLDLPVLVLSVQDGFQNETVTQVSCCYYHTAVIENGILYMFGNNWNTQLGLGREGPPYKWSYNIPTRVPNIENGFQNENVTKVSCGATHTALIIADSDLYTFGDNYYGQLGQGHNTELFIPTRVLGIEKVTQVSCGFRYTAVISKDVLYTFGLDDKGQLGQGNITHKERKDDFYIREYKKYLDVPTKVQDTNDFKNQNVTQVSCGNSHTAIIQSP